MAFSKFMVNLCFVIFFNAKFAKKKEIFAVARPSYFEGCGLGGSFSDFEKTMIVPEHRK
jgi:hypothetical protein